MYLSLQMYLSTNMDWIEHFMFCNKAPYIRKAFSLALSTSSKINIKDAGNDRFSQGGKSIVKYIISQCSRIDDVDKKSKEKVQEDHKELLSLQKKLSKATIKEQYHPGLNLARTDGVKAMAGDEEIIVDRVMKVKWMEKRKTHSFIPLMYELEAKLSAKEENKSKFLFMNSS